MTNADVAVTVLNRLLGGRLTFPKREALDRHYSPIDRLHLTSRPVSEVVSVTDQTGADVAYDRAGSVLLLNPTAQLHLGWQGPRCTGLHVDVQYVYGYDALPEGVSRAVDVLAAEMDKAQAGEPCRLPDRVTSVNRQGVSWTVIDPQDFLQDGRTGLIEVDSVLSAYNRGKARARARAFSPEFRPPTRMWDRAYVAP